MSWAKKSKSPAAEEGKGAPVADRLSQRLFAYLRRTKGSEEKNGSAIVVSEPLPPSLPAKTAPQSWKERLFSLRAPSSKSGAAASSAAFQALKDKSKSAASAFGPLRDRSKAAAASVIDAVVPASPAKTARRLLRTTVAIVALVAFAYGVGSALPAVVAKMLVERALTGGKKSSHAAELQEEQGFLQQSMATVEGAYRRLYGAFAAQDEKGRQ